MNDSRREKGDRVTRTGVCLVACSLLASGWGLGGRALHAQLTARDSAAAVVVEYFARRERRDWLGAAALLEPHAFRSDYDRLIAAVVREESYPDPPLPTVEALMRQDRSLTREKALDQLKYAGVIRYGASSKPHFLRSLSSDEMRSLSLLEAAAAILRGWDPRERHEVLNAWNYCPPGQRARSVSWKVPRVLGAVAAGDSTFWVALLRPPLIRRDIPPVMGVRDLEEGPDLNIGTITALRTPAGWRVRDARGSMDALIEEEECAASPR